MSCRLGSGGGALSMTSSFTAEDSLRRPSRLALLALPALFLIMACRNQRAACEACYINFGLTRNPKKPCSNHVLTSLIHHNLQELGLLTPTFWNFLSDKTAKQTLTAITYFCHLLQYVLPAQIHKFLSKISTALSNRGQMPVIAFC